MNTRGENDETMLTTEQLHKMAVEQLTRQGEELGLAFGPEAGPEEMIKCILARQEVAQSLSPDVLSELLRWGGRKVSVTADRIEMVREIATVRKMNFASLSHQALVALAAIRGVKIPEQAQAYEVIRALKSEESLFGKLGRKRRQFVGQLLSRLVGEALPMAGDENGGEGGEPSLKDHIEERGIVAGLAEKLRGAADDYVAVKLDEIEERIDKKLDEIDRRLAEWRDREIANRLRIIKYTLWGSIAVALVSVVYAWLKKEFGL